MTCHLFATKPSSEAVLVYWLLYPWERIAVKYEPEYRIFIPWIKFENIDCKMATIFVLASMCEH